LPAQGYRRTAAIPGHVPDKLLPAGDCASALAILRRREPDWLLSSFIYGIKDALRIGRGQIPEGARSASPGLL